MWLRPDGEPMTDADWANPAARAVCATGVGGRIVLLVNGWWEPLGFTVPALRSARFAVVVDTSRDDGPASIGPADELRVDGRALMLLQRDG